MKEPSSRSESESDSESEPEFRFPGRLRVGVLVQLRLGLGLSDLLTRVQIGCGGRSCEEVTRSSGTLISHVPRGSTYPTETDFIYQITSGSSG